MSSDLGTARPVETCLPLLQIGEQSPLEITPDSRSYAVFRMVHHNQIGSGSPLFTAAGSYAQDVDGDNCSVLRQTCDLT